ncbi:FAD-dependent oxidoreductase [Hyphobacterium sp. HN65]|uniref:FAD-dependent oxidoreductase n=1 Tax=Hyphobacterium lacteum TaxID=3116575 RepID=A0ABU7LMZ1_9PROT|nr:FAD-dependent oxidoreductase [Hyphobacterium sp. HN65]MEE2524986.1 FAD-dependent oxidoreductase [Hyphobacterium sp. HN65]
MSPIITPDFVRRKKIAIIGAGISGLGAAWALRNVHDITLFEKRDRLGGHANTVDIDYDGTPIAVDTGFIVFNPLNYPNMVALFDELGVESFESDMSFSFSLDRDIEWSSNGLSGLFAQKRNAIRPSYLAMLRDVLRFNRLAQRDLDAGNLSGIGLGHYLEKQGFGDRFVTNYLLPMGAAIWSASEEEMRAYPAEAFVKFFQNHRLMHMARPQWRTVKGGSREYVSRIAADLQGKVSLSQPATAVWRNAHGVLIETEDGKVREFDEVILACHSNQSRKLIRDLDAEEANLLGAIGYSANRAVLHRDESLCPGRHSARAAWNYCRDTKDGPASVTYDMNRLQGIDPSKPLFVTLNPHREPDPAKVFGEFQYDHPQFNTAALAAQRIFNRVQGVRRTWFAGAWLGYGFHEDGLRSGLRVALRLGGQIPWDFAEGDITGGRWGERPDTAIPALTAAE